MKMETNEVQKLIPWSPQPERRRRQGSTSCLRLWEREREQMRGNKGSAMEPQGEKVDEGVIVQVAELPGAGKKGGKGRKGLKG
jgi:hypothetical protein